MHSSPWGERAGSLGCAFSSTPRHLIQGYAVFGLPHCPPGGLNSFSGLSCCPPDGLPLYPALILHPPISPGKYLLNPSAAWPLPPKQHRHHPLSLLEVQLLYCWLHLPQCEQVHPPRPHYRLLHQCRLQGLCLCVPIRLHNTIGVLHSGHCNMKRYWQRS